MGGRGAPEFELKCGAGQGGAGSLRLYDCAEVFQFAATVSFGCATVGSLLMEDLLRYYGEKD